VAPESVARDDIEPGIVGLRVPAWRRQFEPAAGPRAADEPIAVGAIPYFAWANRAPGAMRVWIPRRDS
jgi:DUF1680 family protein